VIAFETSMRIGRPIEQVFSYVADPLNFPHWNSAVQDARDPSERGPDAIPVPLPVLL
jgi:uncharacterized protein YndB with AHSA1/START domain